MVKCSVVIPNYNGVHFLDRCLRSLDRQTMDSFEIILVDNASSDGSSAFVRSHFPEVKIIEFDRNHGFSKAANAGIAASRGEFIALLNNDTEVESAWLEHLYLQLHSDEGIFSVSSKMLRFDERDMIDDAGDELTVLGWAFKRGDGEKSTKFHERVPVFSACAGAAMYRKAVFEQIGLFDEKFFAYLEDVDMGYRAQLSGYRSEYCPEALVYHIGSGTSGSRYNEFKIALSARNSIYVFYKNMPLIQLAANLPFLFAGFLIKYIFFAGKGFGRNYCNGIFEALTSLRGIPRQKFRLKYTYSYLRIQWKLISSTVEYIKNRVGF